jgi:hypothetical protein
MCALDGLRALAISIEEILLQKKKKKTSIPDMLRAQRVAQETGLAIKV